MLDQVNALDPNSLAGIRNLAKANSPEAAKAVAKQFEAMFLQVVMKSLRDATPSEGAFDSDATRFYQGLYDQQLVQVMAQRGGVGLAAVIERQLLGDIQIPAQNGMPSGNVAEAVSLPGTPAEVSAGTTPASPQEFVEQMWSQASAAARSLEVPPHFLIAQAALETGWGKSVIKGIDGGSSYNLFNIKAGKGWRGPVVEAVTTEYENGQAVTRTERFRAYASYAESFQDYADLLRQSPRYAAVTGQSDGSGFARALQYGGYATDPGYADKLTRVINGNTLRQALFASAR